MKKRTFTWILSLIFILSSFMSITALAASSSSQDGLVATLSTDKESYDLDEEIGVSLTVENTNTSEVTNIRTEIILPDGVTVTNGSATQDSFTLLAGESSVNELTVVKAESTSAGGTTGGGTTETGDNTNAILWAVLAIGSLIGLVALVMKNKKNKALHSIAILLSLTILATGLTDMVANASTVDGVSTKSFTVSESILIDGEENLVTAKISYDQVGGDDDGTVTITFNTGEGTAVEPITLPAGSTMDGYPSSSLEGYNFELWYTDPSFTNLFDYTQTINEDMYLYAKFTETSTDELVTYDATELYLDDQPTNFSFTVYSEDKITSSNIENYMSIESTFNQATTYNVSSNGNYHTITCDGGYIEGALYSFTFDIGTTLISPETEGYNLESITKLSIRIHKDEVVDYELNQDIVTIDVSKMISLDDEYHSAVVPAELIDETTFGIGTVVYFENGEDSFYVKVTYVEKQTVGGEDYYYFTYDDAELEDIYDHVDIHFENMEMEVTAVAPEDEIAEMVRSSEGVEQLTLLLAAAILDSDTVSAMGDGTDVVDVNEDADVADFISMLTASSTTSDISMLATDSTNTSISGKMFANNASLSTDPLEAYTLAVALMEGLDVEVTLANAENTNFAVEGFDNNKFATDWVGANIMLTYKADLGNHVKLNISVDFSQYLNVTLGGTVSDKYWSWSDFMYYVDFDYRTNVYSQTDLNFTILVCSSNNDTQEDPDPNEEASDEELWGEAWTDITDEVSGIIEDEDSDSETLVAQMMAMLEEDGDYITLIDEPIFTFSCNAYVIDVNVDVNFVVKAAFAAGISADFSYLSAQQYGLYTKDYNGMKYVCNYNNALDGNGRYVFELSVCGYVGVKAGVALEIGLSLPALKSFGNVGLGVEVGAYADLYAYARYIIAKTDPNASVYQSLDGSIYFETGIYLEAYLFAESEMFDAKESWTFLDYKWPLLSAGQEWIYLGLNAELNSQILEDNTIILTGDFTSYKDCLPAFYGNYMSIKTGEMKTQAFPSGYGSLVYESSSSPYISAGVYFYDNTYKNYDHGFQFMYYLKGYGYSNGVYTYDLETDYDKYSEIYGDYDIVREGDMAFNGTVGICVNYIEGTNFMQTGDTYIGDMDFIWLSDKYDGSLEDVGKPYTATFVFESEDGETIVLGEKTVYSGKSVTFNLADYLTEELRQEYALDTYTHYEDGKWVTDVYYEWDEEPSEYMVKDSDVTFTLTAPKRYALDMYVYYDESSAKWIFETKAVENGSTPELVLEDGNYTTFTQLRAYNTITSSTSIITDTENIPATYTSFDLDYWEYSLMLDAERYNEKESYNDQETAIFFAAKKAAGFVDTVTIYIADYEFDTYDITYVLSEDDIRTETLVGGSEPSEGLFCGFYKYSDARFLGWSLEDDGTVDYGVYYGLKEIYQAINRTCYDRGYYLEDDELERYEFGYEDITLYAIYDVKPYTISLYNFDGTEYGTWEFIGGTGITGIAYDTTAKSDGSDETVLEALVSRLPEYTEPADDIDSYGDYKWMLYLSDDTGNMGRCATEEELLHDLELIEESLYKWGESYDIRYMLYGNDYYKMTIDPGEGSFTSEEDVNAVLEGLSTYYYSDAKLNADGTITLFIRDDWFLNTFNFYPLLVAPEEDDSYTYEFDYWADENGNKIDTSSVTYATEAMTFVPVYKAVEKPYYVYMYTSVNDFYSPDTMTTFEGNYTECQAFITENITKYKEGEVTEQTDSTTTTFTGYELEDAQYSPGGYTYYTMYMYYETATRQYNITYTDNIGSGSTAEELDYGSSITKTLDAYATEDYTYNFLGWDVDGDDKVDSDLVVTGYMELTAVWEQTCTITFNYRLGGVYKTYTGVVGEPFTEIPDDLPDTTSLTFVGWSEEMPTTFTKNMTIDPVFETTRYTVTFELITDGVTTTYEEVEVEHNTVMSDIVGDSETAIIPTTPDEAAGKIWGGWGMEDVGTLYFDSYKITSDTTVTATITSVYVSYMTGTTQYSKEAVDIGETVTVADMATGYGAWSIDGATLNADGLTFTMPSNDVTLTALADLAGTFTISDGTNTNVYDATTYDASPTNTTMSGYTFDTTNGILWINSNGLTLSGEASDMMIIVEDSVTSLTLQDLTIQNSTKKSYTIPDFVWQDDAEGIESDPINDMVIYVYSDEFNLTIDGDVEIIQTNETDGRQHIIYYMNLQEGTYDKFDEEAALNGTPYEDCWYETTGLIPDTGKFTMTGINGATFTASSINAGDMITINGDATISGINFNLTSTSSYTGGINVTGVYLTSGGSLEMSNCIISGEVPGLMVSMSMNGIFTNCRFDITSGEVYSGIGDEQMMSFIGATSGSIPGLTAQGLTLDLNTGCEIVITGYIWCYDKAITLTDTSADPSSYTFDPASGMLYDADGVDALTQITFTGN